MLPLVHANHLIYPNYRAHLEIARLRLRDAVEEKGLGHEQECARLVREGVARLKLAGEYPPACAELVEQASKGKTHSHFVALAARSLQTI